MKYYLIFYLLLCAYLLPAQSPKDFEGKWKGDLYAFSGKASRKIADMKLEITPTDTAGVWNYIMTYSPKDIRNYKLRTIDSQKNKYAVDEGNDIILTQDLFCTKFVSCFETGGSLLVITLEKKENGLLFEVNSLSVKDKKKSGRGSDESPFVYSYPVAGFQRALLIKE